MRTLKPKRKIVSFVSVMAIFTSLKLAILIVGSPCSTSANLTTKVFGVTGRKYGHVGPATIQTTVASAVYSFALFCEGTMGRGIKPPFWSRAFVNAIAR